MTLTLIQDEARDLPTEEKVRLIDFLWNSLSSPEIKARELAWADESERRIQAFDSGSLTARDASEVFSDLKKA